MTKNKKPVVNKFCFMFYYFQVHLLSLIKIINELVKKNHSKIINGQN